MKFIITKKEENMNELNKEGIPFGAGIPDFTPIPKTEYPWHEECDEERKSI